MVVITNTVLTSTHLLTESHPPPALTACLLEVHITN